MQSIPITINGYNKLKKELDELQNIKRPAIIKEIQTARAHGDLSENAEYKCAKEKQSFIEGRISQIQDIISRAQIVEPKTLSGNKIQFGATVSVRDESNQELKVYQIVGKNEADLSNGLISYDTPLGSSLINKSKGETITVLTPRGDKEYTIIDIQYI